MTPTPTDSAIPVKTIEEAQGEIEALFSRVRGTMCETHSFGGAGINSRIEGRLTLDDFNFLSRHITAITAERDRLKTERDEYKQSLDTLGDRFDVLEAQMDAKEPATVLLRRDIENLKLKLNAAKARAAELEAALPEIYGAGYHDALTGCDPSTSAPLAIDAILARALTPQQREASGK